MVGIVTTAVTITCINTYNVKSHMCFSSPWTNSHHTGESHIEEKTNTNKTISPRFQIHEGISPKESDFSSPTPLTKGVFLCMTIPNTNPTTDTVAIPIANYPQTTNPMLFHTTVPVTMKPMKSIKNKPIPSSTAKTVTILPPKGNTDGTSDTDSA